MSLSLTFRPENFHVFNKKHASVVHQMQFKFIIPSTHISTCIKSNNSSSSMIKGYPPSSSLPKEHNPSTQPTRLVPLTTFALLMITSINIRGWDVKWKGNNNNEYLAHLPFDVELASLTYNIVSPTATRSRCKTRLEIKKRISIRFIPSNSVIFEMVSQ